MEDHAKLCHKQELYGLLLNELLWFKFYLYNRKRYCSVGGIDCYIGNIDVDVPQGSCLKPLLFLIYINDLPKVATVSTASMYTDDISPTLQSQDKSQLDKTVNDDLKCLDL